MARKIGSAGRFGVRYGKTIRQKVNSVEERLHAEHTCPFCFAKRVKRVFAGVWHCSKCDAKFAGGAYAPGEKR